MAAEHGAPHIVIIGQTGLLAEALDNTETSAASLRWTESLDEAEALLRRPGERAASVIVIGAAVARPLLAARRLLTAQPLSQLLILRPKDQARQLAGQLGLLPDLSGAWAADADASPGELREIIGKAVEAARSRRQSATLPDKLNLMLAGTRQREAEQPRLPLWQSFFGAILSQGPDPIFATDSDGNLLIWNEAAVAFFGVGPGDISEPSRSIQLPRQWKEALREQLAAAASGERIDQFETRQIRSDGREVDLSISLGPVRDEHDRVVCVSCIARDVTSQKQLEAGRQLLVRELNHRVKNVLALMQSIARRTAQNSHSVPEFLDAFDGRLQAMSAAHSLLSESWWQGASLEGLSREVLDLHARDGRIAFDLPPVQLPPKLASSLALILNELATNAAKHGALSAAAGRVLLSGRNVEQASKGETVPHLELSWTEDGGPPSSPPDRTGFGTRLIGQLITYQHHGHVEMEWTEAGLRCRMTVPLVDEQGDRLP